MALFLPLRRTKRKEGSCLCTPSAQRRDTRSRTQIRGLSLSRYLVYVLDGPPTRPKETLYLSYCIVSQGARNRFVVHDTLELSHSRGRGRNSDSPFWRLDTKGYFKTTCTSFHPIPNGQRLKFSVPLNLRYEITGNSPDVTSSFIHRSRKENRPNFERPRESSIY